MLLVCHTGSYAQGTLHFDPDYTYSHQRFSPGNPIRTFKSVDEAETIIRSILDVVGLKQNIEIRASDISNAAAVVYNGERYILYDRAFIQAINSASSTYWAGISILAHEIGHHLNGHTLIRGGSNHADELEADEFSGFILKKLGANLEESQAAMHSLSEDYDTATHPERNKRLKAIASGWSKAGEQSLALKESNGDDRPFESRHEGYKRERQRLSPTAITSQDILREVILEEAPDIQLFITTQHQLVGISNDQVLQYGEVKKNQQQRISFCAYGP